MAGGMIRALSRKMNLFMSAIATDAAPWVRADRLTDLAVGRAYSPVEGRRDPYAVSHSLAPAHAGTARRIG